MDNLQRFIHKTARRAIGFEGMARLRLFAQELAEGAVEELWKVQLPFEANGNGPTPYQFDSWAFNEYLRLRWSNNQPNWELLQTVGYIAIDKCSIQINASAFNLLDENDAPEVFISYRRKDSSAFALLVLNKLKQAGIDTFLDLAMQAGTNWQSHIRSEIQSRSHFVLLIGKGTLASEVVQREISWAIEANATIIPIWHNEYVHQPGQFRLPPDIERVLRDSHSIRVLEESALAYNVALIELLSQFGVTP
jgi:hypothetical protein